MNQEQLNSLIRIVMNLAGAFLIGGGLRFFGQEISQTYWEEITGFALCILSIWWSIKTKAVNDEKFEGLVRQGFTFIGGILLARGILNDKTLEAVGSFITAILPFVLAGLARVKSKKIAAGEIKFSTLKGVDEADIAKNPYVADNKANKTTTVFPGTSGTVDVRDKRNFKP